LIEYQDGTVVKQIRVWGATQELLIRMTDGSIHKAIHYTENLPCIKPGDRVRLNTIAVSLGLGSGGYHYVHDVQRATFQPSEQSQHSMESQRSGHIMKLRYTSLQRSVLAAEEPSSPHHELFLENRTLEGMPVLIGELHSMLPIVAAWVAWHQQKSDPGIQIRMSYVMTDGAALPLAFSRHTHTLRELGWITGTVTYGHAYGGDVETVNKFTALLAAKHVLKSDITVVIMGPGIVGTGTPLGHSGMEVGELIHAVRTLGGEPIVIPRISFADQRERHQGLCHHLQTLLSRFTLVPAWLPIPAYLPEHELSLLQQQLREYQLEHKHSVSFIEAISPDKVEQCLNLYPLDVKSMGRGLTDDPSFFISVSCAAELALRLVPSASPLAGLCDADQLTP
jgi:hypothetical protein